MMAYILIINYEKYIKSQTAPPTTLS